MERNPQEIMEEKLKCGIDADCVHGAGCALTTWPNAKEPLKMPLLTIDNGKVICWDFKK